MKYMIASETRSMSWSKRILGFPFGGGNMPDMGGFGSATLSGTSKLMTLIVYGLCLLFMLALLIGVSLIRRRR